LGSGQFGCGGSVAKKNDQSNIRGEEDNVDLNDEGEKGVDNEFNSLCNKDDTYDDTDLVVGVGVAGNNNQKRAAEQEAPQATYKAELVTGKKRSDYLMRKLTIEEEDTVEWALSPGALLPSSLNQKDLLTIAGRKGEGKLNTNIINMYTQDFLKQCDKQLCLQEQERRQSLFYGSEFIDKYFDKTNIGSYHYEQVIRYSKMAPDGDIFKSKYIFFLIHSVKHFELAVVFVEEKMICNYDPLLVTTRTRNKCVHKTDIQETKLKGFLQYLKDEHVDKKGFKMPDAKKWELKSMDKNDIPQQENVSDCGVFICMFCDYILNGCKLNFKQDDIMEGSWRQKMILSILTTCGDNDNDTYKEGMEYESDNDMEVIIQPTKKTKGKRN
jgi:hypothetical protein